MNTPEDLYYTKEHIWVKQEEDNIVTMGLTDYAQNDLGEIVFVELPKRNESIDADESFSTIESVKSANDLILPVSGTILEGNKNLEENPTFINEDPYGSWIIKVKIDNESELDDLLDADDYRDFCEKESS